MSNKINLVRSKMHSMGIDGMVITNPINIRYLIGVKAEGTLIINDKTTEFLTDARYLEDVNNTLTIEDEIYVQNVIHISDEDYIRFFADCTKVGFEENYMTYRNYTDMIRKYRIKDAVETNLLIEKLRQIKNDEEIRNIEKACNITDSCFLHILDFIKIGKTEREIAIEIEKFCLDNGADGLSFETIVASGENSSKPHAIPSSREIKKGDALLLDFGAKVNGYCSDMTRTIFVGEVDDRIKNLYDFLFKVQERAFEKIKSGVDTNQITKSVQNELYTRNFDLIHALGHGIGLETHETPVLSTRCTFTLKENMVITNEPGIYIPGKLGIRIEDTILVNNMSATNLTKSNKNLLII